MILQFLPETWLYARASFNETDGEPMNCYARELCRRDAAPAPAKAGEA